MEQSNQTDENDHDPSSQTDQKDGCFFDVLEDFPFHDSDQSASDSTLLEPFPEVSHRRNILRRRSRPTSDRGIYGTLSNDSNHESSCISSYITENYDHKTEYKEKGQRYYRDLKENENNLYFTESNRWNGDRVDLVEVTSKVGEDDDEEMENDDLVGDSVDTAGELGDNSSPNLLECMARLVIKAIWFEVRLFFKFITFPILALYNSYMFVIDPFGVIRRGRGFLMKKLIGLCNRIIWYLSSLIIGWLKDRISIRKLLVRFAWRMFWSFYVCMILCILVIFSMMVSGSLVINLLEKPVQIREELSFDYTENSPVAFAPIMSCGGVGCDLNCVKKSLGRRVVQPNDKLEVNVLLTLPESAYNKNLGLFQVRVDLLSPYGKTLASKRQLCMLKFRSEPVRFLLNFFKIVPLVTGYTSEIQTLKVKIRGFKEGDEPTSCLKVTVEQRAEFQAEGGVPEIYDASLVLETDLSILKRIIWCWKNTIFACISMMLFIIELLFTIICCRPAIIPRTRSRGVPALNNSTPNNLTK
ncbi:hypothetical protein P3X46_033100 [Hevea brasiliensis]|uniref:Seipin n=1 Tax=Hevea brasiliensis TaxID=3981 RepID=A0ABQ9KH01_HEVBR|nr:hypothetical protein P3X46_033100 [Hevea brasiliensis]KAJ9135983.1 hypothetical protein P3X46_033100 [Hevea brasiliensis]